ncbi:MAG: alanine glycine permease [Flavobacteriaceae bacterium]|nr:alanine glycine permease [Flavobacteriaceae bacterium]|tara:strand:+ start:22860 stop:24452 length:1593 start_codon:yes stop_codon:yes gene_type:complete
MIFKKQEVFLSLILSIIPSLVSAQDTNSLGLDERINEAFKPIANWFESVILHDFPFTESIFGTGIPTIIILLVGGALFFTIYFGFVNIRQFPTAVNTVRGKYDSIELKKSNKVDDTTGEVSHFQALATAVSGTVGNGNIAGVAMAIAIGGPGATFWMILCGLLGMSTKFVECTLGVKYRDVGEDGTVYGGPMYYMTKGLNEIGYGKLGKLLAIIFALLCIGASFGGGNAAQSNQAAVQLVNSFGMTGGSARTIIGLVMMIFVGIIIIGGIKRIASVTEKVVPFMALLYIVACLYIIITNITFVDDAFGMIFSQAFNPSAGLGGLLGVLITGFRRAAFSNEAGAGSASIAHSAVKTNYPASEGLVALLEPFIDTVVICTMTALVIIIFNGDSSIFDYGGVGGVVMIDGVPAEGASITAAAFSEYISFSGPFLTLAVVLFAFSTMISWSYYGLQSWMYVFGKSKVSGLTYKILFLIFIVIGAAGDMSSVWGFSDAMILGLVFPNMIGLFFLFPMVKNELSKYMSAIGKSLKN